MKKHVAMAAAAAFFGLMAENLVEHAHLTIPTQGALTGMVGYLGALAADLIYICYAYRKRQ